MAQISVIIPTLNAAHCVRQALDAIGDVPIVLERLVVDGQSGDDTIAIAAEAGAKIILMDERGRGRGTQLAAGAAEAKGNWLLFLHADTVLERGWVENVECFIDQKTAQDTAAVFRFSLDDPSNSARRLEAIVAWRCRVLGMPYGDQGLLISRTFYDEIGGFRKIPLFEDVDLIRRIGRSRLALLNCRAVTSAARYQMSGYLMRPLRNLFCLTLYLLGVSPHRIVRLYGGRG